MKKLLITLALIAAATPAFAGGMQNAAIDHKNDQWTKYINWVGQTSARQNSGKADYRRVCEPEIKSCSDAMFYFDSNNIDTMVREQQDIDGKPTRRDVCRFNKAHDVRTCVDWYSEALTKEMKDINGKWIFVQE